MHQYLFIAGTATSIITLGESVINHSFPVAYPFDTPSGLALSMCCVLALTSDYPFPSGKWYRIIYIMCQLAMATTIVCTKSRIGVVSLGVVLFWILIRKDINIAASIIVLIIVSLLLLLTVQKSDSTTGRLYIYQTTFAMIRERPIRGWGIHGFQRYYMLQQARFLEDHPNEKAKWLADDIRHPLNEFLLWWVNGGIIGLLFIFIMLFIPLVHAFSKYHTNIHCEHLSLIQIALFALVSYPLHYPIAWLVILNCWKFVSFTIRDLKLLRSLTNLASVFCIILVLAHGYYAILQRRAEHAAKLHHHRKSLSLYASMYSWCAWNPHFIYSYMSECYTTGNFDKALELNNLCAKKWCNYNLTLYRADILFHLHDYNEAIYNYHQSSRMCPVRFAPLEGLLESYNAIGDTLGRHSIAATILNKHIKVPSPEIDRIKAKAYMFISSISQE